jgi:hypothetical protein
MPEDSRKCSKGEGTTSSMSFHSPDLFKQQASRQHVPDCPAASCQVPDAKSPVAKCPLPSASAFCAKSSFARNRDDKTED